MLIQSTHNGVDGGADAYWTPYEATESLLKLENFSGKIVWEPAAGDGAILRVLEEKGVSCYGSDLYDYGNPFIKSGLDYLKVNILGANAIVTNPPSKLALPFAQKAICEVPFVAFLLRTNWLESTTRLSFFRQHPPSRVWISSRRLPMIHRLGWDGPEVPSNICHAWFVWDAGAAKETRLGWFDWSELTDPLVVEGVDPTELDL